MERLAHGGARGVTAIASLLCGASSSGFTDSEHQLLAMYEPHFLQHNVRFDHFVHYVEWYKASLNAGLKEAEGDLLKIKDDVMKVCF